MKRRRILYWRVAVQPGLESIFKDCLEQLGTELDADFLFLLAVVDLIAWTEIEANQSVLIETAVFLQE